MAATITIKGNLSKTQEIETDIVSHDEDVVEGFLSEVDKIDGSISSVVEIGGLLTIASD